MPVHEEVGAVRREVLLVPAGVLDLVVAQVHGAGVVTILLTDREERHAAAHDGMRWRTMACGGARWHAVAHDGMRRRTMACGGARWHAVAVGHDEMTKRW
jgi:hypothetical protein